MSLKQRGDEQRALTDINPEDHVAFGRLGRAVLNAEDRWKRRQHEKRQRVHNDEALIDDHADDVDESDHNQRDYVSDPRGLSHDMGVDMAMPMMPSLKRRVVSSDNHEADYSIARQPRRQKTYTDQRRVWLYVGDIVLTIGLVMGLFVFWAVSWTDVQAGRKQDNASQALEQQWAAAGAGDKSHGDAKPDDLAGVPIARTAAEGQGFAKIHAPKLGDKFTRTVVSGVTPFALNIGPGHYRGSASPGESGNFALAGHRDGQGAPFHDLGELNTCDAIVIETATQWLTYRVLPVQVNGAGDYLNQLMNCMPGNVASLLDTAKYSGLRGNSIVKPSDVDVVAPVPNHPEIPSEQARVSMLTLTTCHPFWSNEKRLIIHAALVQTDFKSGHESGWVPDSLRT